MVECECDVIREEDSNSNPNKFSVYRKRWLILTISVVSGISSNFNGGCFGNINNVLVKFFRVRPNQVDWFVLSFTTVYIVLSLPGAILARKIGFRMTFLLQGGFLLIGNALLALGTVVENGYAIAIIGEVMNGISFMLNFCIIPLLSSIWFPLNEVALAVGLQMVARALGFAIASVTPPHLVNIQQSLEEIRLRLFIMFIVLVVIDLILLVLIYFIIDDAPPSPPSISIKQTPVRKQLTVSKIFEDFKDIFSIKSFFPVLFVFATTVPIMINFTALLASILHKNFPTVNGLNKNAGLTGMGGWLISCVSGTFVGPVLSKSRAYKPVLLFGTFGLCLSNTAITIGLITHKTAVIYAGVVCLGIFDPVCSVTALELMAEVLHTLSIEQGSLIMLTLMAVVQFVYLKINRYLLTHVGAWQATVFPLSLTFVAGIVLCITPTPYLRTKNNTVTTESHPLLQHTR